MNRCYLSSGTLLHPPPESFLPSGSCGSGVEPAFGSPGACGSVLGRDTEPQTAPDVLVYMTAAIISV